MVNMAYGLDLNLGNLAIELTWTKCWFVHNGVLCEPPYLDSVRTYGVVFHLSDVSQHLGFKTKKDHS